MKKFSFAKYLRGKKNRIGVQGLTSYGKVSECGFLEFFQLFIHISIRKKDSLRNCWNKSGSFGYRI